MTCRSLSQLHESDFSRNWNQKSRCWPINENTTSYFCKLGVQSLVTCRYVKSWRIKCRKSYRKTKHAGFAYVLTANLWKLGVNTLTSDFQQIIEGKRPRAHRAPVHRWGNFSIHAKETLSTWHFRRNSIPYDSYGNDEDYFANVTLAASIQIIGKLFLR